MKTFCVYLAIVLNNTGRPVLGRTTGYGQCISALGNSTRLFTLSVLLLAAGAVPAFASDPVGVYAFVDKIVLEPNDTAPERVQIWGGFTLAQGSGETYGPAQRGYLYFKLKPDKESICRNEWADLKSIAGTGKIVAFGMRYSSNGVLRKAEARPENPDVYPVGFGVQKLAVKDYKPVNELNALNALKAEKAPDKKTR